MDVPGGPVAPTPPGDARADDPVEEVLRLLPSVAALPLDDRVEAYEHAARVLAARLDDVGA